MFIVFEYCEKQSKTYWRTTRKAKTPMRRMKQPHDTEITTASTTAIEVYGTQVCTSGEEEDRMPDTA